MGRLIILLVACGSANPTSLSEPVDTSEPSSEGSGQQTGPWGDTDSAGPVDSAVDTGEPDPCAGVPVVTYASFGEGFMLENCQGCHASTTEERYGAPESVTFDTIEEVWAWAEVILAVATGEEPAMPPQGGVHEDDRTKLEWWLGCAEPGS